MDPGKLEPNRWYFVRKPNGTLIPYRLHRVVHSGTDGEQAGDVVEAEMYVGSMLKKFPVSQIVAAAEMPNPNG